MKTQVAVIEITENGTDRAVYLNGQYILSADPGCGDSIESVEAVAESLAKINRVDIQRIPFAAHEDWSWYQVGVLLQDSGDLAGALTTYVIPHRFITNDGDEDTNTSSFQAESHAHAVEQLVDEYRLSGSYLLWVEGTVKSPVDSLLRTGDGNYHLNPRCGDGVCIAVGNLNVHLKQEVDGCVVDVYAANDQGEGPLGTLGVCYSDAVG